MKFLAVLAGALLAGPVVTLADDTAVPHRDEDVQTLVVAGSRAIALGYDARGVLRQRVDVEDAAALPSTMAELLADLPGVTENGQGGWVQMYSLRGVSRLRVVTFLAGIPILTDRRAGTAAHFVDPALIAEASVMTGPASSVYGVGALGGIVQFQPRQLMNVNAGLQSDDNGDGRGGYLGWGDGNTTLMLAALTRDDSEAADGTVIPDHGERWSALLRQRWQLDSGELEWLALPAQLRDVGRANANFYNGRITTTPEEDHLPMRLSYKAGSGWEAAGFVHDSSVHNQTERVGTSLTSVDNDATDAGMNWQWPWRSESLRGRLGVDWLARLQVEARESIYTLATDRTEVRQALADGEEQQLSLFSELETGFAGGELQWGMRLTGLQQTARGEADSTDQAWAMHLGWERRYDQRWLLFGSAGSAVRFPVLTERFYNGTTGRGTLNGNAELAPETALSVDLGLRVRLGDAVLTAQLYRQQIDDYIEQIVVQADPQINSYTNLDEGTISGAELAAHWSVSDTLTLQLSAHRIRGKAANGETLADIPADRWQLGLQQQLRDCAVALDWHWRNAKTAYGPDEIALAAADYGEASLRCELGPHWRAAVVVSNAGDEWFYANADSQAALMPGRRISLRVSWQ